MDIIIGLHSIAECLKKNQRNNYELLLTEDAKALFRKKYPNLNVLNFNHKILSPSELQKEAQALFKANDFYYSRVPSGALLKTSDKEFRDVEWLYDSLIEHSVKRVLFLDQVSDINNAAAIMRTASFYAVDCVVFPAKSSFKITPSFYRIASGATEFVEMVAVNNLSKTLRKITSFGINTIALSEHVSNSIDDTDLKNVQVLVLGQEESGISNAVMRSCSHQLSLSAQGDVQSLNVSVAAAVAMEKCFG